MPRWKLYEIEIQTDVWRNEKGQNKKRENWGNGQGRTHREEDPGEQSRVVRARTCREGTRIILGRERR